MKARIASLAAAVALGLAGGCALLSPPEAAEVRAQSMPGVQVPDAWQAPGTASSPIRDRWLLAFDDAALNTLVEEALAHNPDLQASAARIEQAAAYVDSANAGLLPQLSGLGNFSGKSTDAGGMNYAGLFASWELDLWGRVRYGREAARMQLLSTELANEYAKQSLAAMVARSWFLATEARQQKALADEMVKSAEALVGAANERARVGIGSSYDVVLARASLASYRDVAEQTDLALKQALQALEALVGRYPAAELQVRAALPALPAGVPAAGLPSELLERRPDVVAAERRVAAAFNLTEEARAARLPTLSLKASGSTLSSDLLLMKERDDFVWGYGGRIVAPLYLGGSLEAQIRLRTAEQQEAVADYGRTASAAFADVERSLASSSALEKRQPLLAAAVSDNQQALALAQTRYRIGTADLRSVEQQQLAVAAAKTSLLRVQGERLVQRVNLYLALGGSF